MHMKRLVAPRTWPIKRRAGKFIVRPLPGGHPLSHSTALVVMLRDIMHLVNDAGEAKKIITTGQLTIDGVVRRNPKFAVGLMDVMDISGLNKIFRVSLDSKGRLSTVEISPSERNKKVCRIKVKKHIKGGLIQFGLHDGRTVIAKTKDEGRYKVNDSLLVQLPEQKLLRHLPADTGMSMIVVSGKHAGVTGTIKDFGKGGNVVIKADDGDVFETPLRYVLVLGKKGPEVKVR